MIFFDSYAILEVIKGNPNYEKYNEITFITNTLNLAEVFYSLIREIDEKTAINTINSLNFEFIEITKDIAIQSSIFRYKNRKKTLSYADCIGYITAIKKNMKFLTGDGQFKNLENVEFVKKG